MTRGQRLAIGLIVAFAISAALWLALAYVSTALAQSFRQNVRVMVQFENPENVNSLCLMLGVPYRAGACANSQVIIAPNPCLYRGEYAEMMCHELRHVNGWPADHRT